MNTFTTAVGYKCINNNLLDINALYNLYYNSNSTISDFIDYLNTSNIKLKPMEIYNLHRNIEKNPDIKNMKCSDFIVFDSEYNEIIEDKNKEIFLFIVPSFSYWVRTDDFIDSIFYNIDDSYCTYVKHALSPYDSYYNLDTCTQIQSYQLLDEENESFVHDCIDNDFSMNHYNLNRNVAKNIVPYVPDLLFEFLKFLNLYKGTISEFNQYFRPCKLAFNS